MPQFRITAPDGTVYNVTGPDGATEQDALAQVQAQHAPQPQTGGADTVQNDPLAQTMPVRNSAPQQQSALDDVVNSAMAGAASIPAGLSALMHPSIALGRLLSPFIGSDAAGRVGAFADAGTQATFPTANAVANSSMPLASYQPQTVGGDFTKTALSLAPAAFGGAGGLLARAARVAAPAVASEAAGQLTKGTPIEPLARLGGALAGGIGEAYAEGAPPSPSGPSTDDLKDAAQQMYDTANQAGVVLKNDSLKNFSNDVAQTVAEEGLSKRLHPAALGALQDIQDAANSDQPITLKGLDLLRQNVGDVAATAAAPSERRIAGIMRDKLDDFMGNIGPNDVLAGDPQQATQALSQARDLWATYKKSATIDQMIGRAKSAAGANYTQAGYETALRQQFRALANNPARMRGFSPDEQDQILQVVRGGPVDNALRSVGRFVTRGPVSGMMTMGATALGGPMAGTAMTAAAELARHAATSRTIGNIGVLQNLITNGSAGAAGGSPPLLSGPVLLQMLRSGLVPTLALAPSQYQPATQ